METLGLDCLEWGVAASTLAGQSASGDRCLVLPRWDGALVAAIDGLGHGAEAAHAADRTIQALCQANPTATALQLIQTCHAALTGTRGVVLGMALFSPRQHSLTWIGIGNVEGLLLRQNPQKDTATEHLIGRGGVVGDRLPSMLASLVQVRRGDLLLLATDGIAADFERSVIRTDSPQAIADRVLAKHCKGTDDALVIAVRYMEDGGLPH